MKRSKDGKRTQLIVDEEIMNELLSKPEVRKNVMKMTPDELKYFKELLVSTGTYEKYLKERKVN